MIELGQKVRDTVTGFEGIAVSRLEYLNGCVQYLVKPKVGDDGKLPEGEWIDAQQVEVVDGGIFGRVKRAATGGPVPNAPKSYRG